VRLAESLEFVFQLVGIGRETFVLALFHGEELAVSHSQAQPERQLLGGAPAKFSRRPDQDFAEEFLHIGPVDSVRHELRRHHVVIQKGYCD